MIGKFLEFSLTTQDIQASLDFYGRLGFSQAEVGEAWTHPYAVLTDGRVCLGLHQEPAFAPSTTFVKPDLLRHVDALVERGLKFEICRLGNDVFNEVGWLDPSGHLIRLLEARTFSPSKRSTIDTSLCGYFVEMALPSPSLEEAKRHWEQFGFVGMDEPEAVLPHVSCTSDTVDVGLYHPEHVGEPTLLFEVDDLREAVARLGDVGITGSGRVPAPLRRIDAALLRAPEGTPILLSGTQAR